MPRVGHIEAVWTVRAHQLMHPDVVLVECAGDLVGSRGYIVLKCHLTVAFLDKVGLFFFLPQVYFSTVFFFFPMSSLGPSLFPLPAEAVSLYSVITEFLSCKIKIV